jgi:hypothetical protein
MMSAAPDRRAALQTLAALAASAAAGPLNAAGARFELAGGRPQAALPFELIDNRLFVQVVVDGRGPLHFVFDTGGGNILDLELAQALGLPLEGAFAMPGAGAGTLPAWRTQVASAQVGPLRMREMPFVVLPMATLRRAIGFARVDGLIGHEVLRRFGVRLDFVNRVATLSEPDHTPAPPADASALPIEFTGNLPHVAGWIDGRPARIVIDSGDRSSLTLFGPFVDEHRLRQTYPRKFAALTGWGVGGPLHADVTQVKELLLGPVAVRGVTTRMPTGRGGVFASSDVQASIGTGVLKRLDVGFDYSRRRVLLAPNAHHSRPDPVDHSGFWLAQGEGDFFVVEHASADTPAHRAGLRPGDRVLAVDGQAAVPGTLPTLRQHWSERGPGHRLRLSLATGIGTAGRKPARDVVLILGDRFVQPS